ncbi:polysaccharide biosynthesis/export family protein [Arcticibacter sp.]|uniref:polysaccharide biosynthesis/export family protein n=1 Tax=Arcticibacter sp. TaxID=1872630 RepID=UPI0038901E84
MRYLYIPVFLLITLFSSCGSKRNLVYFSDLSDSSEIVTKVINNVNPVIQQNDILDISVNTLSAESNVLFIANPGRQGASNSYLEKDGYKVNQDGMINFPVVGFVKLAGLNLEEAQKSLTKEVNKYVKDPVVNVKYLNFRITVIGEVNRPETFLITDERINLLEALGRAGDMTPYGKRENVLVIREADGVRNMVRLNLNKKSILNSPYFYLKQNDVIYVEAEKTKEKIYSNSNRLMPVWVSAISAFTVLLTAFLYNN